MSNFVNYTDLDVAKLDAISPENKTVTLPAPPAPQGTVPNSANPPQQAQQPLRVHQILGATQADHPHLHGRTSWPPSSQFPLMRYR